MDKTLTFTFTENDAHLVYAAVTHYRNNPKSAYDDAVVSKVLGEDAGKDTIHDAFESIRKSMVEQSTQQLLAARTAKV